MTKQMRTIGAVSLGLLVAGLTGCGGAAPLAPTTVTSPMAANPGDVSMPYAGPFVKFSGTVTEMTANGPVPVKDAYVEVCGYDMALTDDRGFYTLTWVPVGTPSIFVQKAGYEGRTVMIKLSPDGRLDVHLQRE